MKNIRPLRTEEDYEWALAEIERYFDKEPEPGTPEATRFDALAALIAAYEAKHEPSLAPRPRVRPSVGPEEKLQQGPRRPER